MRLNTETMVQQIIFDCDGVLVDTEVIAAEVTVNELNQLGINISTETYIHNYSGKMLTSILKQLEVVPENDQSLFDFAEAIEHKIYSNLRAIEGMPQLVTSLELPIALASNSNIWQVEKVIDFLDLSHLVKKNYFSAEMVEHPKPHPDVYLLAAETVGKAPDQCLVVEDSMSGAKAALTAGMHVIGFCGGSHIQSGHDSRLKELGVKTVAYNASDLSSIIMSATAV